ncbi:hypothetical protein CMI38_03205 [Candidatus Pacearchaeota archaeon]|jgi:hypothetical protein|nr:hypothetical protein [Candidatus Pacearchaeota archaeon]|tara:strand:+ start:1246 stop:2052 length:807 start_codon:yes stop_codon:yes gene_type:complete
MESKKHLSTFKFVKEFFIAILIVYSLFFIIFTFFQGSFIYFPTNQSFEDCPGFSNYEKKTISNTRFYFKQGNSSINKAIIYYHGNAGSACDRSMIKNFFEKYDYTLIFVEYSGYSNDKIKPNKERIFKNVENIHNFLINNNYNNNIVYGASIGSSLASYHASLGDVEKLILVSPFSSMKDLVKSKIRIYPVSLILKENYDNLALLSDYNNELLILHGDTDKEIPAYHSKNLYENIYIKNKKYTPIKNFGHNDLWLSNEFKKEIDQFIK